LSSQVERSNFLPGLLPEMPQSALLQHFQGCRGAEPWQVEIGEDKVPSLSRQRGTHFAGGFDAVGLEPVRSALQRENDEFGIVIVGPVCRF
jgi:hypothetical protein